jgi:ubiquinol-cytochrome c reductase cytochrome b subunit
MKEKLLALAQDVAVWLDKRLYLSKLFESTAGHHVPKSSGSWFYVFGSGTLLCFVIQVVTGALLALVYVPSAASAYTTLEYLTFDQPLGWLLRAIHNWGSNFMVAIMLLHMIQVFLFGAFKYPRELTWITGVFLFFCTLGMAFTGQVLRFDQDSYWGLGIGAAIAGRTPIIGPELVHMMLGGPIIAGETLSRFFTLHVFVLPGAIIALVSFHLRLVLTKGISEFPKPGHVVRKATYDKEYEEIIKREGVPFFPAAISKDLIFSAFVLSAILFCAILFGPVVPEGVPDPTLIDTVPKPDFFFLWIYAALALLPAYMETFLLLTAPVVGAIILFAIPFVSSEGEKSAARRPVAVLSVIMIVLVLGVLNYLGTYSPWSPHMEAWTSAETPKEFLQGRTPLELQGALVIQYKQCRNCHAIDGIGGLRGPDLAGVGTRLTRDQLVRQVIQGGGNMPAYGKNLKPEEIEALVAYMVSLRPPGVPPARDSTHPSYLPSPSPSAPAQPKTAMH